MSVLQSCGCSPVQTAVAAVHCCDAILWCAHACVLVPTIDACSLTMQAQGQPPEELGHAAEPIPARGELQLHHLAVQGDGVQVLQLPDVARARRASRATLLSTWCMRLPCCVCVTLLLCVCDCCSLVNVSGLDIVDGNSKLGLALLWQVRSAAAVRGVVWLPAVDCTVVLL